MSDRNRNALTRNALTRYRVMAWVVGVMLLVLCAAIVVRYGPPDDPRFSRAVSPVHGFLYMVYLVTVLDLSQRARWPLVRTVGVMLAGTVPVVSFLVERRVHATERARQRTRAG